jgi:hypothetical protein
MRFTFLARFFPALRLIVTSLWAGSLWTVGYLVAPVLFSTLPDRVLAGSIAGSIFRIEAWLSLGCGLVLLAMIVFDDASRERRSLLRLIVVMLLCVMVGYFGLQPWMAALREAAGPSGVMEGAARTQFGILHGVASLIYLFQSLLASVLVLKIRKS